jgi:pilus assembly protein CpaE
LTPSRAPGKTGADAQLRAIMPTYLLNADADGHALEEIERRLRPAIPDLKRAAGLEEVGKPSIGAAGRSLAILVAPSAEKDFDKLIGIVNSQQHVFFVIAGGDISAQHYKQLIRSGNADWVPETASPQEILGIFKRVSAAASETRAPTQPVIVSFVPSAGGVGNSTLAVETSVQLVKRKVAGDRKIALIDLDFESSHVCDYLDIAPKFRVDEFVAAPERLDDQLLEAFASSHSSGLVVFAVPRHRFQIHGLGTEALSVLFDRLAYHYAYIIADLPVSAHAWTIPLLHASEGILVTGVNTIPGLRQTAETLAAIHAESGITADVRTVVNRCEFGLFGGAARNDHIARVLGAEKRLLVRDASIAMECVNMGTPMSIARPSDRAVKDIAALVDYCAALKVGAHRHG